MKKSETTSVLHDLMTRLQEHDVEMSTLRTALDAQLVQLARLQAEVEVLRARESLNAPGSQQGSVASPPFTDRQEVLFSAARGWMWQP
jgi:hypothetical protein